MVNRTIWKLITKVWFSVLVLLFVIILPGQLKAGKDCSICYTEGYDENGRKNGCSPACFTCLQEKYAVMSNSKENPEEHKKNMEKYIQENITISPIDHVFKLNVILKDISVNMKSFNCGSSEYYSACMIFKIINNVLNFFATYIALPLLLIVLYYYFYDFTRRFQRGEEAVIRYFMQRVLMIILSFMILLPAKYLPGIPKDEERSFGVWLTMNVFISGMETAGYIFQLLVKDDNALLTTGEYNYIKKYVTDVGGDKMLLFLSIPTTEKYAIVKTHNTIKSLNEALNEYKKTCEEFALALREQEDVKSMESRFNFWSAGMGILGFIVGIYSGDAIGALISGGMAADGLGIPVVKLIEKLKDIFADKMFLLANYLGFYYAVIMGMIKVFIFAYMVPVLIILLPLGRFGFEKLPYFLTNLTVFFLTPLVSLGLWFIVLIARFLYAEIFGPLAYEVVGHFTDGGVLEFPLKLAVVFVLPMTFIIPLAYIYARTPHFLSQIVGNVFQTGLSSEGKFDIPFAR